MMHATKKERGLWVRVYVLGSPVPAYLVLLLSPLDGPKRL